MEMIALKLMSILVVVLLVIDVFYIVIMMVIIYDVESDSSQNFSGHK